MGGKRREYEWEKERERENEGIVEEGVSQVEIPRFYAVQLQETEKGGKTSGPPPTPITL